MIEHTILIRHRFEGVHRWTNAPNEVAFLRAWHRHMFHVELRLPVAHHDRDMEFFVQQGILREFCRRFEGERNRFEGSCEWVAKQTLLAFPTALFCSVAEDGENAGEAWRREEQA